MEPIHLKIGNYKCFAQEPQGFETIESMNIIIGRNNSGKSALLDLVSLACDYKDDIDKVYHGTRRPKIVFTRSLEAPHLRPSFQEHTSGGDIGMNHWQFGQRFIGKRMTVELLPGNASSFVDFHQQIQDRHKKYFVQVATRLASPLKGKTFVRLAADRDIVSESDEESLQVDRNGAGFTNTIQRYLNKSFLPSALVEETLLHELNSIFAPDANFTGIFVQQHLDGRWEVYLGEPKKGRIALSQSGSGLKTILLVLGFMVLMPHIKDKKLSDFVFSFEELENNLHPALQRRLFSYIRSKICSDNSIAFATTHSNAVIDVFSKDKSAQIVHVTHTGESALARRVTTYVENRGVLDDLDVRASDLLQANGIVWVEGPSDRLYFNRWMHLFSQNRLQEGVHYQCVFYGGRLLAHLTGAIPFGESEIADAVRILAVNKNAILIMDSDKRRPRSKLSATKLRVESEVESFGGVPWITAGREIENYLPTAAVSACVPKFRTTIGAFDDIAEILDQAVSGEGARFRRNKVLFAEKVIPHLTLDALLPLLDMKERLRTVSQAIANWNGIAVDW